MNTSSVYLLSQIQMDDFKFRVSGYFRREKVLKKKKKMKIRVNL